VVASDEGALTKAAAVSSGLHYACTHSPCSQGGPLFGLCDWCVATVCGLDSTCCTQTWGQQCVEMVWTKCGQRCNCDDICSVGNPFNAYACACTGQVCGDIPGCCRSGWGTACLQDANKTCGTRCAVP
jgi:hypothetical protein